MLDQATFEALQSEPGQRALAEAMTLDPSEERFLTCFEKLRKKYPPPLAKAALEMAILRIKAHSKFASAAQMYFTREALEQASGDLPAKHRAQRFSSYSTIADLCCGIGGDALAFARSGLSVHAIESDPLRLTMARANAAALGLQDRIYFHQSDAIAIPLSNVQAAFADPSRRAKGQRYLDPEDYTPSLSMIRGRFSSDFPLGVKIAPGVVWNDLTELKAEVEFVSVAGELKECVLWFGPLQTAKRRATLLPEGTTLSAIDPAPSPPVVDAQLYVYDLDPAVVRAGLATRLAIELGVSPLDVRVALFTSRELVRSPFVTPFRIELTSRFHLGKLRDYLRENRVGRVTIIKRGTAIDSDDVMKKLKLKGDEHRVIMLARLGGEETMLVGERVPEI